MEESRADITAVNRKIPVTVDTVLYVFAAFLAPVACGPIRGELPV